MDAAKISLYDIINFHRPLFAIEKNRVDSSLEGPIQDVTHSYQQHNKVNESIESYYVIVYPDTYRCGILEYHHSCSPT